MQVTAYSVIMQVTAIAVSEDCDDDSIPDLVFLIIHMDMYRHMGLLQLERHADMPGLAKKQALQAALLFCDDGLGQDVYMQLGCLNVFCR